MNAPPPRRTGSLWAVAIGLLLLGLAGCACNSLGIAGAVMQQRMVHEMSMEPAADEVGDAFTGVDGMYGKMEKWAPITMGIAIVSLVFSSVVLICAVLVLIWHRTVPKLVPAALMATIAYTVLETGIGIYSQYDMMSWTQDLGGGAGLDGFMGMSLGFSLCTSGGWAFLKIAFFVYAAMHLRKEDVVVLFGGQAPAIGPRGD